MKIDFAQQILTVDGLPIPEGVGKFATLKSLAQQALQMATKEDANLPIAKKVERFDLLLKITNKAPEVNLEAEEIALLKELMGKAFSVLAVGQILRMLEKKPTGIVPAKNEPPATPGQLPDTKEG